MMGKFIILTIFCFFLSVTQGVRIWAADADEPKARPIHLTAEIQPDNTVNLHWTDDSPVKPLGYIFYYAINNQKTLIRLGGRIFSGNDMRLRCAGAKNFRFKLRPVFSFSPLKKGRGSNVAKVAFSEILSDQTKGEVKVNDRKVIVPISVISAQATPIGPTQRLDNIEFQAPSSYTINLKNVPGQDAAVTIQTAKGQKVLRTWALGSLASGQETLSWNGKDKDGNPLPNGSYLVWIAKEDGKGKTTVAQIFSVPWKPLNLKPTPSPH